jgi:predicted ATP-binding protein involved in virulence
MMLALVADLAIKTVTQNAFLLPFESAESSSAELPNVLAQTPGVVLIDELDVHLHPNWQRRISTDLKRTFPSIQFVCTSHSPQVIGELSPSEIRLLVEGEDQVIIPRRSFGVDSSRVLEEVMDAETRNTTVKDLLSALFEAIDREEFSTARNLLSQVEDKLGPDDPEVTRARSLMSFLESPL